MTKREQQQKTIEEEIKRRNAAFKNATNEERRVMVAKDVIKRIQSRQYRPKTKSFVRIDADNISSMQELILDGFKCEVCALGALACSAASFWNSASAYDVSRIGEQIKRRMRAAAKLNKIFSNEELRAIETAFERGKGYFYANAPSYEQQARVQSSPEAAWGKKIRGDSDRLLAMMRNIVKNKGKFIVPDSKK